MLALTEPTNSVCTALNMPRLVVIFTSFNNLRLILKERSEMCQRDGHLCVGDVRKTRTNVLHHSFTTHFNFFDLQNYLLN